MKLPSRGRRLLTSGLAAGLVLATVLAMLSLTGALRRWFPELKANVTAWKTTTHLGAPPPSLADLPVLIGHAATPRGLVVILSGNAGWWAIDNVLADRLREAGWSVAGVNSLSLFRFFGGEKSPRDVADVLGRIVEAEGRKDEPVVLLGYSFGADVVAVAYGALRPEIRRRIARVVLIAPSREADYAIGFGLLARSWRDFDRDVAKAILAMPRRQPICIAPQDQAPAETPCTDAAAAGATTLLVAGDHHFNGDYEGLGRAVAQALDIADREGRAVGPTADNRGYPAGDMDAAARPVTTGAPQ